MLRNRTIVCDGPQLRKLIDDIIDTGWTPELRISRYDRTQGEKEYHVKMPLYQWRDLAEHQAAKDLKRIYQPK